MAYYLAFERHSGDEASDKEAPVNLLALIRICQLWLEPNKGLCSMAWGKEAGAKSAGESRGVSCIACLE